LRWGKVRLEMENGRFSRRPCADIRRCYQHRQSSSLRPECTNVPTLYTSDEPSVRERLEALWWCMLPSDRPDKQAAIIQCFLDESGTDIADSKAAVVAGLVVNEGGFLELGLQWNRMLKRHGIEGPLHMREFGKHQRLGYLSYDQRRSLLSDAMTLINACKAHSVAGFLLSSDYEECFGNKPSARPMSMYGTCFILTVRVNAEVARLAGIDAPIAYVMDSGNPYSHHVLEAYRTIRKHQESDEYLNVGGLTFGDDRTDIPLQAADVIAWAVRRQLQQESGFRKGFQPLVRIFDRHHHQFRYEAEWLREIAASAQAYMNRGGVD
jgi:hypothetical protein